MTLRKTAANLGAHEENLYYWWFQYLRNSEEYVRCCEAGGRGPWKWVYDLLGDVRQLEFTPWWEQVSKYFVTEPYTVRIVTTEGDAAGILEAPDDDMLLYVNRWAPETKLMDAIKKKIREVQTAEQRSQALEPIETEFRLCIRETNKVAVRLKNELLLWKEANRLAVQGSPRWHAFYTVLRGERPPRLAPPNRNTIDATVSRACRSAQNALDGLVLGVFPAGPSPRPAPLCPPSAIAAYRKLRASHQLPAAHTSTRPASTR